MPQEVLEAQLSIDTSSSPRGAGSSTQPSQPSFSKSSPHQHTPSAPLLPLLFYKSRPAHLFTPDEIRAGQSRLTWQSFIRGFVEHPPGALVELPETGLVEGAGIAHIFSINLDSNYLPNPRSDSQYSFGAPQGFHHNVICFQLRDTETDKPVRCLQKISTCKQALSFVLPSHTHYYYLFI